MNSKSASDQGHYNFDFKDPLEFVENPSIMNYKISESVIPRWYDMMSSPDYQGKLIYRVEKTIPPVVQEVLENCGFIEWDPARHGEEQWNILWKN